MRTKAEIGNSEWFGGLPKGWNMVPLSALFRFSKGLSITKADLIKTGKPVISYGQIHSKQNIGVEVRESLLRRVPNDLAGETSPSRVLSNGFVFADTSEDLEGCGNNVRNDSSHALYGGYHTVVLNPRHDFNSKYLAYLFTTDAWRLQIRRDLVDVKLFSVNQTSLNETYVVVPPTDVQKSIVSYLDERCAAIDDDVKKRQKVIERLKEYKRSLIARSVTKGLDPNAEMRDTGVDWIGEVPASWDMLRIYQLAFPVKNKNEGMKENNLLSLSYGNIVQKDINKVDGLVPASYEGYNIIEPGDIVLRFTDLQNDQRSLRTGLCSFNGIITSAYLTIRPRHELVSSEYFHYVLHFVDTLKVFYNMGGGMRQSLDWHGVSHMFLPIPPQAEQCRIVAYLDERCAAIDEAVSRQEKLIEKLGEYRKSIIHHAVTGKIDCTEA